MEFMVVSKFGGVTELMCSMGGRCSDDCDPFGGMGLAEALGFFWIKLTEKLRYKPAPWPNHHVASLQPHYQLHISILQSTEAQNKLLSTQGVFLGLINTEQVVNPPAVLGPEHCSGFALASYINVSTWTALLKGI